MIPSQMLKGVLEGCILEVISRNETYGYEISSKLKEFGFGDISEGTIYPLLLRIQKNGFILSTLKASENGPDRKYFSLTEQGMAELEEFRKNYSELQQAVERLMNSEEH